MVSRAEDYWWSSARAHCGLASDPLLMPIGDPSAGVGNWSAWLAGNGDAEEEKRLRTQTHTGRPCGDEDFVKRMEAVVGRPLAPRKPGPKPRGPQEEEDLLWSSEEIRR